MTKSVVITGVSTGIGLGIAKVMLKHKYRVFGSVRREEDGRRLEGELGANFEPIRMDVTDEEAVQKGAAQVAARLGNARLSGLVNNAGVVVAGPFTHLPVSEFRRQLEVNLVAPMMVSQAFIPLLGSDAGRTGMPGRIVNISSVAGKMTFPVMGAYGASKHGLEGFSEGLRRELMLYGIDVIVVAPGAVQSEIWSKGEQADYSLYRNTEWGPIIDKIRKYFGQVSGEALPAEAIGKAVLKALTHRKPRVRYAVVPKRWKNWSLPMALPKRTFDRMISKQLGLYPAAPKR